MRTTRIWDLPTRLFHWMLAALVVALVVSGSIGGNAMVWHFRFGYGVLSLLLFRIVWGLVGGRWSRFSSFMYAPVTVWAYLHGERRPEHNAGHSPLGALSVLALLVMLMAQVTAGLLSDDEIAFAGPLTRYVSSATVSLATIYHTEVGKLILIGLVLVHIMAIFFYRWKMKDDLIRPMICGDKEMPAALAIEGSRDDAGSRLLAAMIFAACAGLVAWLARLGG
jgi:cytochrome b